MDFQNYDDYMRNTLGFSSIGSTMGMQGSNYSGMNCCSNMGMSPFANMTSSQMWQTSTADLERMYPDSYRIIYPMVVSACRTVTMPITEDMIERMTNDIHDRAIADGRINVDITVEVQTRDDNNDRQMPNRPRRPRRNRFLRDLIRILLLRELIGGFRTGFPRF